MNILGLNKTTLLDYPEHIAATIFVGGCNLRCPFCHNPDLVFYQSSANTSVPAYTEEDILNFLRKRKNIIHGICITGGEPTLQNDLIEFIKRVKELNLLVKLDTNGFSPSTLETLLHENLLDYVAVDIKNSPQKYAKTVGLSTCDISLINNTIQYLMQQSNVPFEFRTTIVKELHDVEDMYAISDWIANAPHYFLQSYQEAPRMISYGFHAHSTETLSEFLEICKRKIPDAALRGVDI